MSSITDLIREEIESLSTDPTKTNVGTITALADGVAKVEGLSKVMFNEMVEFPNDVLGIALNLEEDTVGCVILGDTSSLKEGDEAKTTESCFPFQWEWKCSVESWTRLEDQLTEKVRSIRTRSFP